MISFFSWIIYNAIFNNREEEKKLFIMMIVLVGVLSMGLITSKELENNIRDISSFESINNLNATSNRIRIFLWKSLIDMFKNNFPF